MKIEIILAIVLSFFFYCFVYRYAISLSKLSGVLEATIAIKEDYPKMFSAELNELIVTQRISFEKGQSELICRFLIFIFIFLGNVIYFSLT